MVAFWLGSCINLLQVEESEPIKSRLECPPTRSSFASLLGDYPFSGLLLTGNVQMFVLSLKVGEMGEFFYWEETHALH